MIQYYDRKTKTIVEEKEYQKNTLEFLYNTLLGRILLKIAVARPWFSNLKSIYQKSKKSKKDIVPFIKEYNIDISQWNMNDFQTFNDFFTRKKEIRNNSNENDLVAIADSKLLAYKITNDIKLHIKQSIYSISDILENNKIASKYENGTCLVFRLAMDDYHRYAFIDSGRLLKSYNIKGMLHTIRPISKKYNVYSRNTRAVSVIETKNLGEIVQVEVGAMLVGKINNHEKKEFSKLDEKGYFEYGGSTIIVLLKNDVIIDNDIIENSKNNIETKVSIGERIGKIE